MAGRTMIWSVHVARFVARRRERELTAALSGGSRPDGIPSWARGVRVERVGPPGVLPLARWGVVLTEERGH